MAIHYDGPMRPVEQLMPRLSGVRETSSGRWIARCPAHDDRSPSLSIRELPDGKILLHDFGGCAPVDVLHAIGLELHHLFPSGGQARRATKTKSLRLPAADILLLASREIVTAAILAADFLSKRALSEDGWERLAACAARLGKLRDQVQ